MRKVPWIALCAVAVIVAPAAARSGAQAESRGQAEVPLALALPWAVGATGKVSSGCHPWGASPGNACSSLDVKPPDGIVLSPVAGTVKRDRPCAPNEVRVVTPSGWSISFYHLTGPLPAAETPVAQGTPLGNIGTGTACEGAADKAHAHMTLWKPASSFSFQSSLEGSWAGVTIGGYVVSTNGHRHACMKDIYKGTSHCTTANDCCGVALYNYGAKLTRSLAINKIIRVIDNGPSYFYDGTLRWIPDRETYWCLARSKTVIVAVQSEVDKLGDGKPWVSPCFDPARVVGRIIRQSRTDAPGYGTAYYVATDNRWHWIPNGETYRCLQDLGHLVIQSNWAQINSLRGKDGRNEGARATCALGIPADGTFLRGKSETLYYMQRGVKRPIASELSWYALGGDPGSLITLKDSALSAIPSGLPISAMFPAGTFLRGKSSPNIYYIKGGRKHLIPTVELWTALGGTTSNLKHVSDQALREIPTGAPMTAPSFPDGTFLRGSSETVYYMQGGIKRPIANELSWYALGGGEPYRVW